MDRSINDGINNTKDFYLIQYNRAAEDWRHISSLIWQIPTVAVAITSAIFGISFQFLDGIPRSILLFLGSLFLFTLSIALAKYRLFHDSRTTWLQYLEKEFKITQMPVTTEETKTYLKNKNITKNNLYNLLYKGTSAIWLLYVIFISSLMLAGLGIYSIVQPSFGLNNEDNTTDIPFDYGMFNNPVNIANIANFLAHPFILALIGLFFSYFIIPKVTKEWRKPKEFEIRMKLIDQINESVAGILTAVYLDQVSDMTTNSEYRNSQITWEKEKEVISSNLRALITESQIISDWDRLSKFITGFHALNVHNDEEERRSLLVNMKQILHFSEDIEIFVKRDKYKPDKEESDKLYMVNWLRLETKILSHKDEVVNKILKIKLSF